MFFKLISMIKPEIFSFQGYGINFRKLPIVSSFYLGQRVSRHREVSLSPFSIMETTLTRRMLLNLCGSKISSLQWLKEKDVFWKDRPAKISWYTAVKIAMKMTLLDSSVSDSDKRLIETLSSDEYIKEVNRGDRCWFRLPTEDEWEFAALGGLDSKENAFPWKGGAFWRRRYANVTSGIFKKIPQVVGKKMPNGYGLYDMAGNVWELTSDFSVNDDRRVVIKGGAFDTQGVSGLMVAQFSTILPYEARENIGVRFVRSNSIH